MTIKKSTLFFFLLTSFHGRLIATSTERTITIQNVTGIGYMENHGPVHIQQGQQQEFICNLGSSSIGQFNYQSRTSPDGQDYMDLIETQLKQDVTNICGLNLKGMGGVGKSTLAYEYARQHRNNPYKLIWFFRCETKESFEQSLKSLYSRFFPTQLAESMDINRLKGDVYDKLHGYQDKILLIYDNVVDQKSLSDKLIQQLSKSMHVIVTSRQTVRINNQILLGVFSEHEAIECLQKEIKRCNPDYSHDLEESQLKEISESLGYLPLAVVQAAAYIATKEITLQDFINLLKEKEKDFLDYDDDQQAIPRSFYKLFLMALEALNNDEKELLYMLSYLTPDDVSATFFKEKEAALKTLKQYSLIRYEQNQISVHRLLQLVGREESKIDKEKIIEELLGTFEAFLEDHLPKDPKQGFSLLQNMKGQLIALKSYQENSKLEDLLKQINDQLFDYLLECLDQDNTDELTTDKLMRQYLEISEEDFNHQKIRLKPILDCFKKVSDRFDVISVGIDIKEEDLQDLINFFIKMKEEETSEKDSLHNFFALCLTKKSEWINKDQYTKSWKVPFENIYDQIAFNEIGFLDLGNAFSLSGTKKGVEWLKRSANIGSVFAQYNLGIIYERGKGVTRDFKKAVHWYEKAAKRGDISSKFNLAICYECGRGVEKKDNLAFSLYKEAAESGHIRAQYNLSRCYENAIGTTTDKEKSLQWLKRSADAGNPKAQYNLAVQLEKERRYADALKLYEKASEKDKDAAYKAGMYYYDGTGVKKNYEKAFELFSLAKELGHELSQVNLGILYANGHGVEQNHQTAVSLWESLPNNKSALYQLGHAYYYGNVVDKDIQKGIKLIEQSAEMAEPIAQYFLACMYFEEKKDDVAIRYLIAAAKGEYPSAQHRLGNIYYTGIHNIGKNEDEGLRLLNLAADKNIAGAQFDLALIYRDKALTDKKYYEGMFNWLKKAADQDFVEAIYYLGLCYSSGEAITKDMPKAVGYWKKAAEKGHSDAQYFLGQSYFNGDGIDRNKEEAYKLFLKAALKGEVYSQKIIYKGFLRILETFLFSK